MGTSLNERQAYTPQRLKARLIKGGTFVIKIASSCLGMLLLVSCGKVEETTVVSSSGSSTNTSYRWDPASFPLTFKYADSFSASEISAINDGDQDWSTAVSNQLDFFDTTTSTSNVEYSNPDSYNDGILGIYQLSTQWPSEFPSTALAVTQLYGYRVSSSLIQLSHVDILMNYYYFSFSTDQTAGTYDFETVMIHELGHAIGLQHTSDSSIDSVMQPSVSTSTVWTAPYEYDGQVTCALYGLTNCSTSLLGEELFAENTDNSGGIQSISAASGTGDIAGSGQLVKIQLELSTDGYCRHFMDGKLVHEHEVHVAKN
jgi:predicted Zn-dependent protease